jgi:hypothetical protein
LFDLKSYLLVECEDLSSTLKETLRYRYIEDAVSAPAFVKECEARLKYVKARIEKIPSTNVAGLTTLASQISSLSRLVTNIERSHLEEFSWPFAFALETISKGVCSEDIATGTVESLLYFRSEGGICSYKVFPDQIVPGISERKIFSVVFPRATKDSVLLHTVLGHEIGHAALRSKPVALSPIKRQLFASSIIERPNDVYDWCVANIGVTSNDGYLLPKVSNWASELFCDLFGLLMMGPAFIPAFTALELTTLDIGGARTPQVPTHPPYQVRAIMLLRAARALGWLYSDQDPKDELATLVAPLGQAFTDKVGVFENSVYDILDNANISAAATALVNFAKPYTGFAFQPPTAVVLTGLLATLGAQVPPACRFPPSRSADGEIGKTEVVDFRTILLAGWLRWLKMLPINSGMEEHFRTLNTLCSYAILQQQGVLFYESA